MLINMGEKGGVTLVLFSNLSNVLAVLNALHVIQCPFFLVHLFGGQSEISWTVHSRFTTTMSLLQCRVCSLCDRCTELFLIAHWRLQIKPIRRSSLVDTT